MDEIAELLQVVGGWGAFLGLVLVVGSLISRAIARVLRLELSTLRDPGYRRWDMSGVSRAVFWLRPGLILMAAGLTILGAGWLLKRP